MELTSAESKLLFTWLGTVEPNEARLWLAGLPMADLAELHLMDAGLYLADQGQAQTGRTYLRDCNLSGANLREAQLDGANLQGAFLANADLSKADLRHANLHQADLSGANLCWADLRGANVTDEQLAQAASLRGAILPDGTEHE